MDLPYGPTPPQLIGPFLDPEGPTMIYGPGGTGKGLTACVLLAGLVQSGHRVLVLDYENHPGEWGRRIRAMGLAPYDLLRNIHYRSPYSPDWNGPKGTIGNVAEAVREECDRLGITYVVIDSYLASTGADAAMGGLNGAAEYFTALTTIGRPSLTIAHVTGDTKRFPEKPYGSIHVKTQCRETWAMEAGENDAETEDLMPRLGKRPVNLELRNTKKSTDEKHRPVFINFLSPRGQPDRRGPRTPLRSQEPAQHRRRDPDPGHRVRRSGMELAAIIKTFKADHGADIKANRLRTIFSNNKNLFETTLGSNPARWRLKPPSDLGLTVMTGGKSETKVRPRARNGRTTDPEIRPVFGAKARP